MPDIDLTISQLGPKADGIAESPQGLVYVDRAVPGDRVRARVRRDEEGVSRGEIIAIIEPSPYRVAAPCAFYDRCGGCTLQHVNEDFYRAWKQETIKSALAKNGVEVKHWGEPIFIGGNNRRRATFSASKDRGKIVLGYYRRRSREISDIETCLIAHSKLWALRESLKPHLNAILVDGKTTDFFVQVVGGSADLVVTGPMSAKAEPALETLLMTSDFERISRRSGARDEIEELFTKGEITASFGKLRVNLPPDAFLQPTEEGERALVNAVTGALPGQGKFADLFAGCGTFSGPLLERGQVEAYESVASAVKALTKAAGGKPLKVFRRDLEKKPLSVEELNRFDAVVFDPPRGGCREQAAVMARATTPTLVGVSCNPATFARDARLLCRGGYRLVSLQLIDQFLWSHHMEMVGIFTR